jgi:hypothetical protein
VSGLKIAVDFDGTIVDHQYPRIGDAVPGAFAWMRRWQKAGARLILWTMRSDTGNGNYLTQAVEFCRKNRIEFFGVNTDPEQIGWTTSPKAYANIYVDDAAFGMPLRKPMRLGDRPMVDWRIVGPAVLEMVKASMMPKKPAKAS